MTKQTQTINADPGMMQRFKERALLFASTLEKLKQKENLARKDPALYEEYKSFVNKGENIKKRVQQVTGGVDSVVNWFTSLFDGVTASEVGQMGVFPLIPIGIISVAMLLMGSWLKDVVMFNKRLDEIQRLESKGLSPQAAANLVSKSMPGGFIDKLAGEIKTPIILGISAVGLYFIFKKYVK